MQTITTFLLFDGKAEEAVNFYCSIFKNSSIQHTSYYGEGAPLPAGTVLTVSFQINGMDLVALNGPSFPFTPAISFQIGCETQEEIDELWSKLTDGGEESYCGWLVDRYGLSWQITPKILGELIGHEDPEKASLAMQAMLKMSKLEIATLKAAAGID